MKFEKDRKLLTCKLNKNSAINNIINIRCIQLLAYFNKCVYIG